LNPYNEFKKYIDAMFEPTDTVCFAFINHKSKQVHHEFLLASDAVTEKNFAELQNTNKEFSIYAAMNTFRPELIGKEVGRTKENIAEIKRLWIDADENGELVRDVVLNAGLVPPPDITVETSPGKYQFIWNVKGLTSETAKPLLQALAQEFGTDPAVADLVRVLRVPGFVNRKYDGAPLSKIVGDVDGAIYEPCDFKVSYKPKPAEKSDAPAELIPHGAIHPWLLKQAGRLRQMGLDADAIEPALLQMTHKFCAPPIDDNRVRAMAVSICSFPAGSPQPDIQFDEPASGTAPAATAAVDPSQWRAMFRSVDEMEDGPIVMVIDGVLQEGTCFIGANPGDGKTLVGLAFAKAIASGTPLFGLPQFPVKEARTVIYLIPESRDRAFRKRCEAFRMPKDKMKFMCRTISAGVSLELGDPFLLQAVRETKPVVFLDTASRFMKGNDENAAAQNRALVNDVVSLLAAGAVTVVLIHHATKAAKQNREAMTLENMLRGSSDLGAMCDQAYGIRKDMNLYQNGSGPMEIDLVNLKDRETTGSLTQLRLAASTQASGDFPVSCIDTYGDFKVVNSVDQQRRTIDGLASMVKADPNIPAKELAERVGLTEYAVKHSLTALGWHRVQGGPGGASPWHQDDGPTCPYAKTQPIKKSSSDDIKAAVAYLEGALAGTGVGREYGGVSESEVYQGADQRGLTDGVLQKARKRLGVLVDRTSKEWSLPPNEPVN
jgi:RepB DNA-primase from phage plasmid/AAA domain